MEKTLRNLIKAFIGESQARNRYTYYAKIAQKEGFEQIGAIFLETADQEKAHAKRLFEHIQELKKRLKEADQINVEAAAPLVYGETKDNLQAAINGETYEYKEMYPEFAEVAKQENLPEIANRLLSIAKAEEHHAERYKKLLEQVKNKTVLRKNKEVSWVCRECGYVHFGKHPPEKCPSCNHPKSYYQLKCEEY